MPASFLLALPILLLATLPQPRVVLGPKAGFAGGASDQLVAVTQDAKGRTLAAGWSEAPSGEVRALVVRFSAAGELDASFGVGGVSLLSQTGAASSRKLFGLAVHASRILVVGSEGDGRTSLGFIAALDDRGTEDRGFEERWRSSLPARPLVGSPWFRSRPL